MQPNIDNRKFEELKDSEKIEKLRFEILNLQNLVSRVVRLEDRLIELYEHKHDNFTGEISTKPKFYKNDMSTGVCGVGFNSLK